MKRFVKLCTVLMITAIFVAIFFVFSACEKTTLRFAAPEGTPALAIARLATDNKAIENNNIKYEIVAPGNIAGEMSTGKADLVIMPINAGANLIRQGAEYKLVSVAVDGSLYMIGTTATGGTIAMSDIIGKKIACIGETGVPGLVFRYVMKGSGITMITEGNPNAANNEILVEYVTDGTLAMSLLKNHSVDFAVVGEPAATTFKTKLSLNAEMNMQTEYARIANDGSQSYPQAGLFVKTKLVSNTKFMTKLFAALESSKSWVNDNPTLVTDHMQTSLKSTSTFNAVSIPRCSLNCAPLSDSKKTEIVSFLSAIMPKDGKGNSIDWTQAAPIIF